MTQGILENTIVSLAFWILDILLIVLLLPAVLRTLENRKWKPMRQAFSGAFAKYRDDVYHQLVGWVEQLIDDPGQLHFAQLISGGVSSDMRRVRDRVDVLNPSMTSELSPHVLLALDAAEEISTILSYVFTMKSRGHPLTSIQDAYSKLCTACDSFDSAVVALQKASPSIAKAMNPSFAFMKYFLSKYIASLEKSSNA